MNEFKLGTIAGLKLTAIPSALVGSLLLFIVLFGIGAWLLVLPVGAVVVGSLVAVLFHWLSEIVHNLGHAWVARRTGFPMDGVRLGTLGLFGTSLYPQAEPVLPAAIHIRRALGGPVASLLVAALAALVVLALRGVGGAPFALAVFLLIDNLFVLGLGAFLPLGFTDGSTILHYWGKP